MTHDTLQIRTDTYQAQLCEAPYDAENKVALFSDQIHRHCSRGPMGASLHLDTHVEKEL